jgi:hypothetical protein
MKTIFLLAFLTALTAVAQLNNPYFVAGLNGVPPTAAAPPSGCTIIGNYSQTVSNAYTSPGYPGSKRVAQAIKGRSSTVTITNISIYAYSEVNVSFPIYVTSGNNATGTNYGVTATIAFTGTTFASWTDMTCTTNIIVPANVDFFIVAYTTQGGFHWARATSDTAYEDNTYNAYIGTVKRDTEDLCFKICGQ